VAFTALTPAVLTPGAVLVAPSLAQLQVATSNPQLAAALTAAMTQRQVAASTPQIAAVLTASLTQLQVAAANPQIAATLVASISTPQQFASTTMAAAAALTASMSERAAATAVLQIAAALAADISPPEQFASATIGIASTLSAALTDLMAATATMAGVSALSADISTPQQFGSALLAATTTMTAPLIQFEAAAATLAAVSTLTASLIAPPISASAVLSITSTMTTQGGPLSARAMLVIRGGVDAYAVVLPAPPPQPATPDGNWTLIAPPGQLNVMRIWRNPPLMPVVPQVGEVGFSIFFAILGDADDPVKLVIRKPSGEIVEVPPSLVYRAGLGFSQLENLAGGTVFVYVTREDDLSEVGTYGVSIEGVAGTATLRVN